MTNHSKAILSVLAYLRYERQYKYIASECRNMDILAYNKEIFHEFEVKVSLPDLKKDLKKIKHFYYESGVYTPDYFCYVVPLELKDYALEFLKENNLNKYGLLVINHECYIKNRGHKLNFSVKYKKRPKKLTMYNKNNFRDNLFDSLVKKMSSELITEKMKRLKNEDTGQLVDIPKSKKTVNVTLNKNKRSSK